MPEHGPNEPNPPDPLDPRQMDDESLKRTFRVAIQDIADDRIIIDDEYTVDDNSLRIISIATEAERELRDRGYDVEEIAKNQLVQ